MNLRSTGFGLGWSKPFLFLLLLFFTHRAAAQQRTLPDSATADSLRRVRADTALAADSVRPPPILARHPSGSPVGVAASVWEWSAEDLVREGQITLTDLLQRVPGATPLRAGLFLQPEMIGPFGHTRGRIEIVLDGYVLDPLTASTVDLAQIPLAEMQRVRIERRLDLTRVVLSSMEATDGRPQSRVEAGVGEPDVNLFRGLFVAPRFLIGPIGLAVERVDTDGYRSREPADDFAGWLKWSWIRGSSGIQAELRQTRFARGADSPWPGEAQRRDLIVRGRASLPGGVVGEVFAGRSSFENDTATTSESPPGPEATSVQWGGRASFDSRYVWLDASARFRDHALLPSSQLDAHAGARLGRFGAATGGLTLANWREAGSALSYDLRLQTPALLGFTAFAEVAGGKRGAPSALFEDSIPAYLNRRSGQRLGLAFDRWGLSAGAALLRFDTDSLQTFGLPFDATDLRFAGAKPRGWEATLSAPLYFPWLRVIGNYTTFPTGELPIYLPRKYGQVALQLHTEPLRSGNLELLGRLELRQRGEMLAPQFSEQDSIWTTVNLPSYNTLDAYVQIRVIDVHLFMRAENIMNELIPELPTRELQTPRYIYGVKWRFWN